MDLKKIKQLINVVEESQISHFSIEEKGIKIEIKKEFASAVLAAPVAVPQAVNSGALMVAGSEVSDSKNDSSAGLIEIKAEMVGTFYVSATPDTPVFVSVGDRISKGQVICIVEAMKLFNEIESEVDGTIEEVCVANESPVEYGQVLFKVRP